MRRPADDASDIGASDIDASDIDDGGAAVVDFVLMSVLLLMLLFGVLQIAVYFYARNVAAASAADAARYASTVGVPAGAGRARAELLIREGLDSRDASAITCTSVRDVRYGLPATTVTCTGDVPLFFSPLRTPLSITVRSSVLKEQRP